MNAAVRTTRLVVGVCGALPKRHAIELAAEMARYFSAQMSALMIEDGSSEILAALPFAREYVTGSAVWRDIGSHDVAARRETAERRARALFAEVAGAQAIAGGLQTLRSSAAGDLARAIAGYDIVVLAAPEQVGEWMMLPFSALADAALHATTAALIVPPRILRRRGPVAAVLDSHDGMAVELAGRIASAANESLVLLAAGIDDVARDVESLANRANVPPERLRILDIDGAGLDTITRTLSAINERILVIGRKFMPQPGLETLLRLATSRGVPLLIPADGEKRSD
jgi:hypothetical protein